jgi:hypothetical protein
MPNRIKTVPIIQPGDTVAFTPSYIERHSHYDNDIPAAQGKVIALHPLVSGDILAEIRWDKPSLPKRVNVKCLIPK